MIDRGVSSTGATKTRPQAGKMTTIGDNVMPNNFVSISTENK